jgi:hypothetical protein
VPSPVDEKDVLSEHAWLELDQAQPSLAPVAFTLVYLPNGILFFVELFKTC